MGGLDAQHKLLISIICLSATCYRRKMPHLPVEGRRMEQQWESSVVSALRWCQCHRWIIAGHLLATQDGFCRGNSWSHTQTHMYINRIIDVYLALSSLQLWMSQFSFCFLTLHWISVNSKTLHGVSFFTLDHMDKVSDQVREVDTKSEVMILAVVLLLCI